MPLQVPTLDLEVPTLATVRCGPIRIFEEKLFLLPSHSASEY